MYFTDKNRIKYFKTLIETPAPERKKALESFYVELFLQTPDGSAWKGSKQLMDISPQESPDFLFSSKSGQKQGLELTEWVNNTKQCRVNQILTEIARDICIEVKNTKGICLSLVIDIYDPRKWHSQTRQEYIDYIKNPGVRRLQENTKNLKKIFLEAILNSGIISENLTERQVEVNEQFFRLAFHKSWFGYPNFHINNNSMYWDKRLISLQHSIDKKNKKHASFLKKCAICDLLITYPYYHTGNPIFSNTRISFKSSFPNVFLLYWDGWDISVTKLKTVLP